MEVTHPPLKIAHVDRFPPVTSQQYELAKKSSIMTIVSHLRAFQRAINEGRGLSLTLLNGGRNPQFAGRGAGSNLKVEGHGHYFRRCPLTFGWCPLWQGAPDKSVGHTTLWPLFQRLWMKKEKP